MLQNFPTSPFLATSFWRHRCPVVHKRKKLANCLSESKLKRKGLDDSVTMERRKLRMRSAQIRHWSA